MNRAKTMVGVGLRSDHYPHIESELPIRVDWFEAITENYMDTYGRPLKMLEKVRQNFPVALHGVSLSIGSLHGIDETYLTKLTELINRIEPFIVSDHLCWTRAKMQSTHDLLPLPFTKTSIEVICKNIDVVQSKLKRQILLENVSTYLRFENDEYLEWDFTVEIAKKTGTKILLDLNNIYVNAKNHSFSEWKYLQSIPVELIGQIHLAGHTNLGTHLFDTHSTAVCDDVWNLFKSLVQKIQSTPVLIEWDENIPEFATVEDEALKARSILEQSHDQH